MGYIEEWIYVGIVSLPQYVPSEVHVALYWFTKGYGLTARQSVIVQDAIVAIGPPAVDLHNQYRAYYNRYIETGDLNYLKRMLDYVQLLFSRLLTLLALLMVLSDSIAW